MAAPALLMPYPRFQAFAPSGAFLVGGFLYTYAAGTSTPQASYTDSTETTPQTNPVVLDALGSAPVWFDGALSYKIVLTDSVGNVLYTVDNINSNINAAYLATVLTGYATTASLSNYVTNSGLVTSLAPYALTSALAAYAPLASPTFTGTPAAPTAPAGTNSTQLATTAFVAAATAGVTLLRSGTFSCINGTVAVSFATPFPTGCNAVCVQWYYTSPTVGYIAPSPVVTASGFSYTNASAGTCFYIATGN